MTARHRRDSLRVHFCPTDRDHFSMGCDNRRLEDLSPVVGLRADVLQSVPHTSLGNEGIRRRPV